MSNDSAYEATPTSGSLADRGYRLFQFLARAQSLRSTQPRHTSQYDQVRWLVDLPEHEALVAAHSAPEPADGAPLLTLRRIPAPSVPEVPAELKLWLSGSPDDAETEPELRESLPNPSAAAEDGSDAWLHWGDDHDLVRAHEAWRETWQAWSAKEMHDRPARELYQALFAMHVRVEAHTEEIELVLGLGLLAWAPDGAPAVSRHVLTTPARIEFNDITGTITIEAAPTIEALSLETDMLDPSMVPTPAHTDTVRTLARDYEGHPLHRSEVGDILRRLVNALHADAEYIDTLDVPASGRAPRAAFAPALIVRRRSSKGLEDVFQTIAAEIAASGEVPAGLIPLLDPDQAPAATPDTTPGALVTLDDDGTHERGDGEVFLPLPLNQIQLDIIRKVDRSAQTLVQGPPGTGKTHTAAALITHLLAQGKRVLVTAQTDRALKEVRSKLPESIKSLAVAVVGSDRSDMADLKVAVEHISSRSSDHDPDGTALREHACLDKIDQFRRQRAELRGVLLSARENEITEHEHGSYAGTLARIAQQYQAAAPQFDWISQFVTPSSDQPPPLDNGEATRWLTLLRDQTLVDDEPEAALRLPIVSELATPEHFSALVDAEERGEAGAAEHRDLAQHGSYEAVAALPVASRDLLRSRMRELARKAGEFERRDESWTNDALRDIRSGRWATWSGRAEDLRALITTVTPLVASIPVGTEVTVTGDPAHLIPLATGVLECLRGGGSIKTNPDGSVKLGFATAKPIKVARAFFDAVRVNRQVPVTANDVAAFLAHTEAGRQLDVLDRAWPATITIPDEDTLRERLQWHQTELGQLDRLLALSAELETEERNLAGVDLPRPDWNDIGSVLTYARLVDAAAASEAAQAASEPLVLLARTTGSTAAWESAASVAGQLHAAVTERDRDGYADAWARLDRLHRVRDVTAERDALTARVVDVARDLAAAVTAEPTSLNWDSRITSLGDAWLWACTGAWILAQDATDTNVVQAQITSLEVRIRRETEVLAATRAWAHAVSSERLTGTGRADLTQYAQLVKALGKGTGKYAMQRRAEIRIAMDRCRPAVPVWILPIYRIAEQLRVSQNMFDVVIVDEASQAGLEATFLQYLAPKIVIIGDDRQVSPAGVGVDQQQLRDLANQFLFDDRFLASWHDPKRSLFDEANMRFGQKLTLVEHRRCVPEIIGFSNRIAYEPDNIRLIPVRQYGADRLEPIRAVHVKNGYERGTSGNKTNPAEVDAIVDAIQKCLTDPRYDGLTFGVISLSGAKQARTLEARLLEAIPAEEWAARDLRCGDAADFQGSERDVVFLSMVAAPENGARLGAATQELYVQRYNVAASRAKDQLWLFHSITFDQVPNSQDMRHHLLDYCYGVIGRSAEGNAPGSETVPDDVRVEPFDSLFEQRVYNRLVDRGFTVIPQFPAIGYNLDLVVVGAKGRMAIECDGDAWHGPQAFEADLARQRDLERCGWQFFRIRESAWYVDQHGVLDQLWRTLDELDIRPSGWLDHELDDEPDELPEQLAEEFVGPLDGLIEVADKDGADATVEPASHAQTELPSVAHSIGVDLDRPDSAEASQGSFAWQDWTDAEGASDEQRTLQPTHAPGTEPKTAEDIHAPARYSEFTGSAPPALTARQTDIIATLRAITELEGPVVGSRLHHAYVTASGGRRVGKQIAHTLNGALSAAVRRGDLASDNPLNVSGLKFRTFRRPGTAEVVVRELGPRSLDEVPPLELATLLCSTAAVTGWDSTETLFRETLRRLGRDRLSSAAAATMQAVLELARSLDGRV